MHLVDDRGHAVCEEVRDPAMRSDTDAIVRVDAMTRGTGLGTVEAIGPAVTMIEVGDRVLVSSMRPGRQIDGSHAELVRVPRADTSTCKVPDGVTEGEILSIVAFIGGKPRRKPDQNGRLVPFTQRSVEARAR
jgi:alcohol dehydrogenase